MKHKENTLSVVVNPNLTETVNTNYIKSKQDAVNAVASLVNCELTPNNVREGLFNHTDISNAVPFTIKDKLSVAQIISALMNSPHTPGEIFLNLAWRIEEFKTQNYSATVLQVAAFIQAWNESEEDAPTLFYADTTITKAEHAAIYEALHNGNRAKAEAMLAAIRSGQAASV